LLFSDERLDLLSNKLDLAISVGPQKDSNYNAVLIGKLDSVLVTSPKYIAKTKLITSKNFNNQSLVILPWQTNHILNTDTCQSLIFESEIVIKMNTSTSAINTLKCGLGIGLVPSVFIKEELASGILQRVLPEYKGQERDVYAIHSYQNKLPLILRKFINELKEKFHSQKLT